MNDTEKNESKKNTKWWIFLVLVAIICIAIFVVVGNGDVSDGGSGDGGGIGDSGGIFGGLFATHPNSDPEKARAALEAAGYYADLKKKVSSAPEEGMIACVDAALDSETVEGVEWIIIYYYEDEESAEAAWPQLEEDGEELREAAIYLGYGSSFVCKKNGTVIYYGTKNAVDAAK